MTLRLDSLRQRLLAALILVLGLCAMAMTVQLRSHARSPEEVIEDSSLATQARALIQGMRFDRAGHIRSIRPDEVWRRVYARPSGAFFTLYDAYGRVAARSANLDAPLAPIPLGPGEAMTPLRLVGPGQALAAAARAPAGHVLVVARANPGLADQTSAQRLGDYLPGLVFLVFAVAGLLTVWWVAAWSLRPLGLAAREAAIIGPENPQARLTAEGLPSEVRPMAEAVNRALDRVAAAYANEKRFTAEAAHALRTPLAVLDLRLQRAEQGGHIDWRAVRADIAELGRVVSGLLTLAQADRAQTFRAPVELNLTRLAREAAAAFAPKLEREGREIEITAPDAAIRLRGEAGELREMLYALIDNALIHGAGKILLDLRREPGVAVLTVSDEGPGVAALEREAVFERFHKLDGPSNGAGLGLSIVRQTARAHGGEARFVERAAVEVRLKG